MGIIFYFSRPLQFWVNLKIKHVVGFSFGYLMIVIYWGKTIYRFIDKEDEERK